MAEQITITKEDDSTPPMMIDSDAYVLDSQIIMLSAGKWVATIHYEFDTLPLYVGVTGIDVSATTINGAAPGTDEPSAVPVTAPNVAPVFTEGAASIRSVIYNTATGMAIGDPVAATDANAGDTLTYSLGGTDSGIVCYLLAQVVNCKLWLR